jgi:hypothetical protein
MTVRMAVVTVIAALAGAMVGNLRPAKAAEAKWSAIITKSGVKAQ